jgi:hypothetical protein
MRPFRHKGLQTGENNPKFEKNIALKLSLKCQISKREKIILCLVKKKSKERSAFLTKKESPSQKIKVFDLQENTTTYYNSINEAARALNISHSIIVIYFARNQQKPYKERYTFHREKL